MNYAVLKKLMKAKHCCDTFEFLAFIAFCLAIGFVILCAVAYIL